MTTSKSTPQMAQWSGDFGRTYTDRNPQTIAEMDALYDANFGVTRTELNRRFVDSLDRELRILEVGANVGTQLRGLRDMGFRHLYGVELQQYAVDVARKDLTGINLIQGNALDVPFKDSNFDLVFTSGVLIHVSPADLPVVLNEVHRLTRSWIWGYEYYAAQPTTISYRGNDDLLWKRDFARAYLEQFPDLEMVSEERLRYRGKVDEDSMFLLRKRG